MSSNLKVNSIVPATGTEIGIGTTGGNIDFRCPATFGGNVTIGGTLTYDEVINIDSIGIVTTREGVFIPDNKELKIGNTAGTPDLKIYHSSSNNNTYIEESGSGYLITKANRFEVTNAAGTEALINAVQDTGVSLYDGTNTVRLATTSTGATVTGDITISDKIIHAGDTNTAIRFPAADTFSVETAGQQNVQVNGTRTLLKSPSGTDTTVRLQHQGNSGYGDIILDRTKNAFIISNDPTNASNNLSYFSVKNKGTENLRITSEGYVRIGGNEGNYPLVVIDESNRTTTADTQLHLYAKHDGSGTTGVGFGGGIRFWGDRASGNVEQNMGRIMCIADVNTGTTLSSAFTFETGVAGVLGEKVRITSGGQVNIGGDYTQTAYQAQITGDLLLQKSQAAYQHPQIELYATSNTAHGGAIKFSGKHSGSKYEQVVLKAYGGTGAGTGSFVIATGTGTDKFRLHATGQLELKNGSFSNNVDCIMGNGGTVEIGAQGTIKFRTATNNVLTIDANGHTIPGGYNGAKDLGSSSYRWRNVYTSDIDLCNESRGGNEVDGTWGAYTIQEGEDDLFLINRRSGKKYKFNLTEVS